MSWLPVLDAARGDPRLLPLLPRNAAVDCRGSPAHAFELPLLVGGVLWNVEEHEEGKGDEDELDEERHGQEERLPEQQVGGRGEERRGDGELPTVTKGHWYLFATPEFSDSRGRLPGRLGDTHVMQPPLRRPAGVRECLQECRDDAHGIGEGQEQDGERDEHGHCDQEV
jgi:hypothetical protein